MAEGNTKNKYGQYFTPKMVADFMVDLVSVGKDAKVLEPACGEGIFLEALQEKGFQHITAYEIDTALGQQFQDIRYESFVSAKFDKQYDLVIGNPPYIRWKNLEQELKEELAQNALWQQYFNSLCDYLYLFILKSIELLKENGQLLFICPEYWMNTTHALSLRNYMVERGYFECIYHFNEAPIFNKARVSVVVFKYIKSQHKTKSIRVVKYIKNKPLTMELLTQMKDEEVVNSNIVRFNTPQFEYNKRWLLTSAKEIEKIEQFEQQCNSFGTISYATIGDVCHIGNGMVSGLDKVFQLSDETLNKQEQAHTIKVIKAKNLVPYTYKDTTDYLFVNDVETAKELANSYPHFYKKLISQKTKLEKRYQYKRHIPFWHWVFLRNFKLFSQNCPRIFVPCKERISNKNHFRFAFVPAGIFPTQDVTAIFSKQKSKESIYYILAFLNNYRVFHWLKHKGIVKGHIVEFSEKPISSIPFRKINWADKKEVALHDAIVHHIQIYIKQKSPSILAKIEGDLEELFNINEDILQG